MVNITRTALNKAQDRARLDSLQIESTIYKQTLREVISIFGDLRYLSSQRELIKIKCMHANPERAVAKLMQETNIILPIISVNQNVSNDSQERNRYDSILVHEILWNEDKQRAQRIISLAPRPINIVYEINVWSKYKEDLDQITQQIRAKFNPSMTIPTANNKMTEAFLSEERDAGSVETGDREDRILRRTFVVNVETYIPALRFLYTNSGKIKLFQTEVGIDSK